MFDGLLPFAGSIISGLMASEGQEDTNAMNMQIASNNSAFNAQQAQLTREFQERMSSTAYRRAVDDMKGAGLNPMLAYSQGGASTPSGATGQAVQPAPMQNKAAAGVAAAAQAAQVQQALASTEKTKAEVDNVKADTSLKAAQYTHQISSSGHLDAVRDNIRQEMTAFADRLQQLREKTIQIREQTHTTIADRYRINQEEEKIRQLAQKYSQEARLLGLKIPEAVQEARFFGTDEGARAVRYRHAPSSSKFGPGLIFEAGDQVGNLARNVTSAAGAARDYLQDSFRLNANRRTR